MSISGSNIETNSVTYNQNMPPRLSHEPKLFHQGFYLSENAREDANHRSGDCRAHIVTEAPCNICFIFIDSNFLSGVSGLCVVYYLTAVNMHVGINF